MSKKSDRKTKDRIPNKTMHALEAIIAVQIGALKHWGELIEYAEKRHDALLSLKLAHIRDALANTEKLARGALEGRYEEP